MPIKSTASRYGAIAILLHWLMAMLLAALIVTGFQAASAADESTKAARLMFHAPLGLNLLLLLVLRILWRIVFDRKPAAHMGGALWQRGAARAVHLGLYLVLLLVAGSGLAMFILSGMGPILFDGAEGPLPDFDTLAPRAAHGIGTRLLIALALLHIGAALYHQFILKDGLLARMWPPFGRSRKGLPQRDAPQ
ncbi:MAG: cytochrome b [Paracoccaceae bacterium]